MITGKNNFWITFEKLIFENEIIIDRARGSVHPRFSDYIYPHDYGHITNTTSTDGMEIDCWIGTKRGSQINSKNVDGIITTIDMAKRDIEIKVLINCTEAEMQEILECHNRVQMSGILIKRIK